MKKIVLALAALALLLPAVTQASLITLPPAGGTPTVLTTLTGSYSFAASVNAGGYLVSANAEDFVYFGDVPYNLADNGNWSNFAFIAANDSAFVLTIDLGGLYSTVGGFMNYAPGYGSPLIRAIAADGTTVLDSYDLATAAPISTPNGTNAGAFRGIQLATPQIRYFQLSNSHLILHDLTVGGATSTVPDPGSSLLLLGMGLVGLRACRKRWQ